MAGKGRSNFIWIIIAIVFVLAVGGYFLGRGDVFGEAGFCANPSGCQCGMISTCGRGQTCDRVGPFGSCK